jgi:hypothetical protein
MARRSGRVRARRVLTSIRGRPGRLPRRHDQPGQSLGHGLTGRRVSIRIEDTTLMFFDPDTVDQATGRIRYRTSRVRVNRLSTNRGWVHCNDDATFAAQIAADLPSTTPPTARSCLPNPWLRPGPQYHPDERVT